MDIETTIQKVEDAGGLAALKKKIDAAERLLSELKPLGCLEGAKEAVAEFETLAQRLEVVLH